MAKDRNMEKLTADGNNLLSGSNKHLTVSEVETLVEMSKGEIFKAIFYAFEVGAAVGAKQERSRQKKATATNGN